MKATKTEPERLLAGAELRRLRLEAGMSAAALGRRRCTLERRQLGAHAPV